jgi:hypothetical protein
MGIYAVFGSPGRVKDAARAWADITRGGLDSYNREWRCPMDLTPVLIIAGLLMFWILWNQWDIAKLKKRIEALEEQSRGNRTE